MRDPIDELTTVLSAELDLHRQIATLLDEEREALSGGKPDAVLGIVRRKETVLLRIRTLDESRQLIASRLATQWGLKLSEVTVSEILRRSRNAPGNSQLQRVRDELAACIAGIQESSARNARVCESGADLIARVVDAAMEDSNKNKAEGYGPNVARRPSAAGPRYAQTPPPQDEPRINTST